MEGLGLASQPQLDPLPSATAAARADIAAALNRSAGWFFAIGALSFVNTITLLAGSDWIFLAGLGITELAAVMARNAGSAANVVALLANTLAAALFIVLGVFSRKGHKAPFLLGMTFYVLDAVILLLFQAWLMVAFHGFVLYRLWQGYSTCSELHAFEQSLATVGLQEPVQKA
jgi:hypothetical protein